MNQNSANKNSFKYIIYTLILGLTFFAIYKLVNVSNIDPLIITANDHVKGNFESKVILVEYSDFQCPTCGAYYPLVEKLIEEYKDKIAFVYRNYPLTQIHQNAYIAAQAAEAASMQGKFWEMYSKIFLEQALWSNMKKPETRFETYAKEIGLDTDKFLKDLQSDEVDRKIQNDIKSGNVAKVSGTPTFILNGVSIGLPGSYDNFKKFIDDAIAQLPLSQNIEDPQTVHLHADFKVYINNVAYDFSQEKYQTIEAPNEEHDFEQEGYVHLHDSNGEIIHVHKEAITVGDFFDSLAMSFDKNCLALDTGEKYCNEEAKSLKFYINGQLNDQFENYEIQDLDRILLTYGSEYEELIQAQIASVNDEACIYSETCPERGTAPTESCVGGLGTKCK